MPGIGSVEFAFVASRDLGGGFGCGILRLRIPCTGRCLRRYVLAARCFCFLLVFLHMVVYGRLRSVGRRASLRAPESGELSANIDRDALETDLD